MNGSWKKVLTRSGLVCKAVMWSTAAACNFAFVRTGTEVAPGGKCTICMLGQQFIGRLLQHVLPSGFKRMRHYGLLAPAAKSW